MNNNNQAIEHNQPLEPRRTIPIQVVRVGDLESLGVCSRCRASGKRTMMKHFSPDNLIFGAIYMSNNAKHCYSCCGEDYWKTIQ